MIYKKCKKSICAFLSFVLIMTVLSNFPSCGKPEEEKVRTRTPQSSLKTFESFKFLQKYNPALAYDATGAIDQTSKKIMIFIKQAGAVDLTDLRPTFTINGSYVERNGEVQQTGMNTVDFFDSLYHPVEYKVYAEDGTSTLYSVIVQFGQIKPAKPGAISLNIEGFPYNDNTLKASYSYFDSNGDTEGETDVSWFYENASGEFVVFHSATRSGESDTEYLKCPLNNLNAIGHRIKLVVTPKSKTNDTTRYKEGVNQQEENGDPTYILSSSTVKSSLQNCVVINEFRASTADITALSDDGQTQTVVVQGTTNEFIELYNPTDATISLSGYSIEVLKNGSYSVYLNFSLTKFVLASPSANPILDIPPKSYYLITNSHAAAEVKKMADVVIDVDYAGYSFPEIPENSGVLRLKNNTGAVVDLVGYGPDNSIEHEGTRCASPAVIDKSIGRTNGYDLNQNGVDFIIKASTPMASGANIIDPQAPIAENIVVERIISGIEDPESGDQSYRVTKKYLDVNYDEEGVSIVRWRPFYCSVSDVDCSTRTYLDGMTAEGVAIPNPDMDKVFSGPFDDQLITITFDDFEKVPDECLLYLEVHVTPVSITGDDPDTEADETIGFDYLSNTVGRPGLCVPDKTNAKLIITQIIPYRNIVNLYALRSGSLRNLSLTCSKYNVDPVDPANLDESGLTDFRVFLGNSGNSSIMAGRSMAVLLKPQASLDSQGINWDNKCSIKADLTNTDAEMGKRQTSLLATDRSVDDGYISTVGGAVSVSELTGYVKDYDEFGNLVDFPQYATRDMMVFALGDSPCEMSDAFKRFILQTNFTTVAANGGGEEDPDTGELIVDESDYAWYVSNQVFPKISDYITPGATPDDPEVFDAIGYNNFYALLSPESVIASVNSKNDYVKIPTTLTNYIVYRPPYKTAPVSPLQWFYDYYPSAYLSGNNWTVDIPKIKYMTGVEYVYNNVYQEYIGPETDLTVVYDRTGEASNGVDPGANPLFKKNIYFSITGAGTKEFKSVKDITDIPLFQFTVIRREDKNTLLSDYSVNSMFTTNAYTFGSYDDSNINMKETMRIIRIFHGSKYIDRNRAYDFEVRYDAYSTAYDMVMDNWRP